MDSPFLALVFLSSWFFLVQSQSNVVNLGTQPHPPSQQPLPPPPQPQPSSLSLPPPRRRSTPHRPPPPRRRQPPPGPPAKQKLNLGKKVGLVFVGFVAIMQVGVVAFLLIMRRRLFEEQ